MKNSKLDFPGSVKKHFKNSVSTPLKHCFSSLKDLNITFWLILKFSYKWRLSVPEKLKYKNKLVDSATV